MDAQAKWFPEGIVRSNLRQEPGRGGMHDVISKETNGKDATAAIVLYAPRSMERQHVNTHGISGLDLPAPHAGICAGGASSPHRGGAVATATPSGRWWIGRPFRSSVLSERKARSTFASAV
jgi:hypothetical protein